MGWVKRSAWSVPLAIMRKIEDQRITGKIQDFGLLDDFWDAEQKSSARCGKRRRLSQRQLHVERWILREEKQICWCWTLFHRKIMIEGQTFVTWFERFRGRSTRICEWRSSFHSMKNLVANLKRIIQPMKFSGPILLIPPSSNESKRRTSNQNSPSISPAKLLKYLPREAPAAIHAYVFKLFPSGFLLDFENPNLRGIFWVKKRRRWEKKIFSTVVFHELVNLLSTLATDVKPRKSYVLHWWARAIYKADNRVYKRFSILNRELDRR